MLFPTQRDIEQVYIAIKWENLQLDNVKFVTPADRSLEIHREGLQSIINSWHGGRSKNANGPSGGQSSVGEGWGNAIDERYQPLISQAWGPNTKSSHRQRCVRLRGQLSVSDNYLYFVTALSQL